MLAALLLDLRSNNNDRNMAAQKGNRTKGYDDCHIVIFSAAYHDLQEIGPKQSLSISGQRQAAARRSGPKAQSYYRKGFWQ